MICLAVRHYAPRATTSLDRIVETAQNSFHLGASAAPYGDVEDRSKAVILNVDTRIWLWERTVRYLYDHPMALVAGIGPDRKWFLEEVLNLPYEGNLIHFLTAHNLFLDILAKGGLGALAPLVFLCVWVFRTAYTSIHTILGGTTLRALYGVGALLFVFWPPFVLANLFGEEMFTDNLQLHWTMLLGILCGLWSREPNIHISREKKRLAPSLSAQQLATKCP
jgi:O-antigen ligase